MKLHFFKREGWIYAAVIMIVLLVHGTGYRYGLPYVEGYDEARLFYNAAIQRGAANGNVDLPGYPPAFLWLHHIVQPLMERITHRTAELDMGLTIGFLRGLAVLANAISTALIVWCGRRISGMWGVGLLAAAAWAIAPDTLYNTVIALTEPYIILTSLLALALALYALYEASQRAAVLSVLAALVGVMFKYSAFPVLGLGVGVALWHLRTERRWFRVLLLQGGLIVVTAAFLFVVADASMLISGNHPETATFTHGGVTRLFDLSWWQMVGGTAIRQLRLGEGVTFVLLLGGTIALLRRRDAKLWLAMIGLSGFIIVLVALTIMYITYTEGVYRYTAPIAPFISLLVCLALWLIGTMGWQDTSWSRFRIPILFGVCAALWLLPTLRITASILQERTRPDTRAALADWSLPILTTESQTILQDSRDVRVFVRDRAGYRGLWQWQKWVDQLSQTPAQWRTQNINWAMATQTTQDRLTQTDGGRAWADDALLLKSFPPTGEVWRGPTLWFYRLTPPQIRTDITWNQTIRLVGYDLTGTEKMAQSWHGGDTLTFTGYWQALQAPSADVHLFVHVRPSEDLTQVVTQADGLPLDNRPSSTWTDAHETVIGTSYSITLPSDIAAGEYVLIIGLYDGATGARWITQAGDDGWEIRRIQVTR